MQVEDGADELFLGEGDVDALEAGLHCRGAGALGHYDGFLLEHVELSGVGEKELGGDEEMDEMVVAVGKESVHASEREDLDTWEHLSQQLLQGDGTEGVGVYDGEARIHCSANIGIPSENQNYQ